VAGVTVSMVMRMPIEMLGFLLADALMALTAAGRYWEVIDIRHDITDSDGGIDDDPDVGKYRGELSFDDVSFHFADTDRLTLTGLDLRIDPGQTLALVGATGSGKTTLASLVPRLQDVTDGAVRIDGIDIRDCRSTSCATSSRSPSRIPSCSRPRSRTTWSWARPVRARTRSGRPCRSALAADFVARLPEGLETQVGEQGLSLSGGQRQRLALARAVIGKPRILVLDDPLSAVDVDTEDRVQRALREILPDSTTLIIAHRPSTAALADVVAVLDEGRIVAQGTHEELLESSPLYRELMGASAAGPGSAIGAGNERNSSGRRTLMSIPRLDRDDEVEQLPPDIAKKARALLMSLVRPHRAMAIFLAVIVVLTAVPRHRPGVHRPMPSMRASPGRSTVTPGRSSPRSPCSSPPRWPRRCSRSPRRGSSGSRHRRSSSPCVREGVQHVQRLDLGYHEKSTSGRLVSRQTSDMESVQQFLSYSLFDTALAVLQMLFIAITLVWLDVPLALVVFAGFVPLFFITKSAHSSQRSAYRRTRTSIAKVIVHFVETMGGIRAVQAYRRQPDRRSTLSDEDIQYRDANTDALRGVAWFAGSTRLVGNITQTVIIVVGAWLVIEGLDAGRRARRVHPLPEAVLRPARRTRPVVQPLSVRLGGVGEDRCSPRRGTRSGRTGPACSSARTVGVGWCRGCAGDGCVGRVVSGFIGRRHRIGALTRSDRRPVRLRRRTRCSPPLRSACSCRRDRRPRRCHRRRQVDAGQARHPLL
jgi:ABC-type multidrug transport system fused ATPase/permease subunit